MGVYKKRHCFVSTHNLISPTCQLKNSDYSMKGLYKSKNGDFYMKQHIHRCNHITTLLLALMMIVTLSICLYIVFTYKNKDATKIERVPVKNSIEKMQDDFMNILKQEDHKSGS